MKGFISDIAWTMFLLIAVLVILFIAIIAGAFIQFKSSFGGTSSSIEFVVMNNRPYILAASLSHLLAEDRQFIEHATEIVAAGSAENASSGSLDVYLKDFFRYYKDIKFISVAIESGRGEEKNLFYVDNVPKKCGDDLSGFCVESRRKQSVNDRGASITVDVGCTDGRILIDQSKYTNNDNKCASKNEACCVESSESWTPNTITCGNNGEGRINPDDPGVCDFIGRGCSAGRIEIEDKGNKCSSVIYSPGKAGTCCVPLESDILVETGLATTAEIPLIYKNAIGIAEVTVA